MSVAKRAPIGRARIVAVWALAVLSACRGTEPPEPARLLMTPEGPSEPAHSPPAATKTAASRPLLVESEPSVLEMLEREGFDLGTLLVGEPSRRASELSKHVSYRTLVEAISRDLAQTSREDPAAGIGMRFSHRQFNDNWLSSDRMRFSLVAIVNRTDRRVFAAETCGEVRFIYRLAYETDTQTGPVDSRLPMTVNVVYFQPLDADGSCGTTARVWFLPDDSTPTAAGRAKWLTSDESPLGPVRRRSWLPKSVEINLQSVRWPSTVRPALGGHAEYLLRVFRRIDKPPYLVPATLENTPDVPRIARNAALKSDLQALLRSDEALARIDLGTFVLPEKFLAEVSTSVSPHGLARSKNRPFSAALDDKAFDGLNLANYATISTPRALFRRLDALTCAGCHQSRSIAGFHMLGVEKEDDAVDSIHVPMSPHFHAELERRAAYLAALAEGRQPSEMRPSAERSENDGAEGTRCGLGDPGFEKWTCNDGLSCVPVDDEDVGVCERASGPDVGDSCEVGYVTPHADAHRDGARLTKRACAKDRVCETTAVGFPGGLCAGGCEALPEGAVCGGIPRLAEFNGCLAAGMSFDRCIAENVRPGALRACSFHVPCRDDYVCARLPTGRGGCLPPYFLFQLRVDGHPL